MKQYNKKALYESIMTSVAKEVKKALNENIINVPYSPYKYGVFLNNKLYLIEKDHELCRDLRDDPSCIYYNIITRFLREEDAPFKGIKAKDIVLVFNSIDNNMYSSKFEKIVKNIDHIEILSRNGIVDVTAAVNYDWQFEFPAFAKAEDIKLYCEHHNYCGEGKEFIIIDENEFNKKLGIC